MRARWFFYSRRRAQSQHELLVMARANAVAQFDLSPQVGELFEDFFAGITPGADFDPAGETFDHFIGFIVHGFVG